LDRTGQENPPLETLAGILRPNHGKIQIAGQPISQLEPPVLARLVALVPQEFVQVFPFTVAETVLMGRFPHRRRGWWDLGMGDESEADLRVAHCAMEHHVVALADRLVSDLPGASASG
jgi:iron complex transport system ATP-binding protein